MGNRLHPVHKRTRADIQICQDCDGVGSTPDPERPSRLMQCDTCTGQGMFIHRAPYRLANGTWSDGVDRVECIKLRRPPNKRWQVYQCATGYWEAYAESDGRQLDEIESFDTHTEAIAYADAQARTNQGESNE